MSQLFETIVNAGRRNIKDRAEIYNAMKALQDLGLDTGLQLRSLTQTKKGANAKTDAAPNSIIEKALIGAGPSAVLSPLGKAVRESAMYESLFTEGDDDIVEDRASADAEKTKLENRHGVKHDAIEIEEQKLRKIKCTCCEHPTRHRDQYGYYRCMRQSCARKTGAHFDRIDAHLANGVTIKGIQKAMEDEDDDKARAEAIAARTKKGITAAATKKAAAAAKGDDDDNNNNMDVDEEEEEEEEIDEPVVAPKATKPKAATGKRRGTRK